MKVLTVYAHHDPRSFCHGVLDHFTRGLRDAGHASEVIDLYAIGFDPVFRDRDVASYIADDVPADMDLMDLRAQVMGSCRGWSSGGWRPGRYAASPRPVSPTSSMSTSTPRHPLPRTGFRQYFEQAYQLGRDFERPIRGSRAICPGCLIIPGLMSA